MQRSQTHRDRFQAVWQQGRAVAIAASMIGLVGCGTNATQSEHQDAPEIALAALESAPLEGNSVDRNSLRTEQPDIETAAIAADGTTRNQVLVNGTPVISLAAGQGKRARVIAERLQSLAERHQLQAHLAQPSLVNGMAVAAIADDVVFTVDDTTAQWYDEAAPDLTVKWVNNLRLALGGDPLSPQEVERYQYAFPPQDMAIQGVASWYGPTFYSRSELASDRSMPTSRRDVGTYLHVNSPSTGRAVVMRVDKRNPSTSPRVISNVSNATEIDSRVGRGDISFARVGL